MNAQVKFKVGDAEYKLQFGEDKEMECLHKMIVLSNPPKYCNECDNKEHFKLDANKDKEGNIYINIMCRKCGAKAKLGQYKTGSYFWHKFEKYIPKTQATDQTAGQDSGVDQTDIPF